MGADTCTEDGSLTAKEILARQHQQKLRELL